MHAKGLREVIMQSFGSKQIYKMI